MLQGEDETIEEFEARITEQLEALITSEEVALAITGIDVGPISDLCPTSTIVLHADATAFERNLALQQTLGPWLDNEIDETCDANAEAVDDLVISQTIVREEAIIDTNTELTQGITILGEDDEGLEVFGNRMRLEFAAGPAIDQASGLPAFSEDCDDEDSAELENATNIINQALSFQAFNTFLNEKFTDECTMQEAAINALNDAADLDIKEADQYQLVMDWFAVCDDCEEDETLDEFIRRKGEAFADSGTFTDSGIVVPDYPLDCLEYVPTMEDSHAALVLHKKQLENNLSFATWAAPMLEAICGAVDMDLMGQTSALAMMIPDQTDISGPLIEGFLFVMDPEGEAAGLTVDNYSAQEITLQLLYGDSGITPGTPQEADATYPGFCED